MLLAEQTATELTAKLARRGRPGGTRIGHAVGDITLLRRGSLRTALQVAGLLLRHRGHHSSTLSSVWTTPSSLCFCAFSATNEILTELERIAAAMRDELQSGGELLKGQPRWLVLSL